MRVEIEGSAALLSKLRALAEGASTVVDGATRAGADLVESMAEAQAPGPHVDVALVEKSSDKATYAIGPDKAHWYYVFIERGAAGHTITGKPLLIFSGRSGTVVTHEVQHPGLAARPFLRPALARKQQISGRMGERFRSMIDGVA